MCASYACKCWMSGELVCVGTCVLLYLWGGSAPAGSSLLDILKYLNSFKSNKLDLLHLLSLLSFFKVVKSNMQNIQGDEVHRALSWLWYISSCYSLVFFIDLLYWSWDIYSYSGIFISANEDRGMWMEDQKQLRNGTWASTALSNPVILLSSVSLHGR